MTDATSNEKPASATASPDFLPSQNKRGKDVRRLNHVPLIIGGGLALLAAGGMSYTFLQRAANKEVAASPVNPGAVAGGATAPIHQGDAAASSAPIADNAEQPPLEGEQVPPLQDGQITTEKIDPALEARLKLIQRIAENRFAAQEAALGAEAQVENFAAQRSTSTPASGGEAGMSAAQLAGLAGAADVLRNAGVGGASGFNPGQGGGEGADPNRQDYKRAFLSRSPELETYLKHTRTAPISTREVKTGTIIPGVMIGGVNSDLPGQIIGQVRENVYDTASGQYVLIPAGARLVGTYDSSVTYGQERVLVAWQRIIYPDGSSVSLELMPGADQSGYAGMNDRVNNHYFRIFSGALMMSLFGAGVQLTQPQQQVPSGPYGGSTLTPQQILTAEIGRQIGQLGIQMTQRNMNIQPTLEIRPGYRFVVMVTKDIVLPPWKGHPLALGQR